MSASILQWNCRGLSANFEELNSLISRHSPKVICLQETYLKDTNFSIPHYISYNKISHNSSRASGGSSIFVRNDIPHRPFNPGNSNLQISCCIATFSSPVTICNIYIPPSYSLLRSDLDDLISLLPKPYIIVGDFNSHSPSWGSDHFNTRGRLVDSLIFDNNLCILNNNSPTYLHPATGTFSMIDLSLCDPSAYSLFSDWYVLSSLFGSDHFPIIISSPSHSSRILSHNWNLKFADWDLFSSLCNTSITDDILSSNSPVSLFTSKLIDIANASIPLCSNSSKPFKPWFNNNCKVAIRNKNRALNNFKRYPTTSNLNAFRRLRAVARRTIKESKSCFWKAFTSTLGIQSSSSKVWNVIRSFKGQTSSSHISHLCINNNTYTSFFEISNQLGKHFAHVSSSSHYPDSFLNFKSITESIPIDFSSNNSENYNLPFTLKELHLAIDQCSSSSKGPDNLHYSFFKHLPPSSIDILLSIINLLWSSDSFPDSWNTSIIIPILKPNKDPTHPSSYRPIALTSCFCKIFERLVNHRLYWFLESNNILDRAQCGFRQHRNCLDHVAKLDTFVRNSFIRNHHAIAIFFDIEKAFDTAWRHGILLDLFNSGLRGHLPMFIRSFLNVRNFKVRIAHTLSNNFIQQCGVPQGSILSPLLFALKINGIIKSLTPNISASLFVDDLAIYASSPDLDSLVLSLQSNINNLSFWCNHNGFRFSNNKTVFVHFHNFNSIFPNPKLFIKNFRIPKVDHARFLGITIDSKLSYVNHIYNIKSSCTNTLNILKILSHRNWGTNRLTLLTIFRALTRSKIDFGSFIYSAARNHYLKHLLTIENEGLRLCLGAFRTSPISSLHVEASELPFDLRCIKSGLYFISRILSIPNHPCFNFIRSPPFSNLFHLNRRVVPPIGIRLSSHISQLNLYSTSLLRSSPPPVPPWTIHIPSIYLNLSFFPKHSYLPSFFLEKFNCFCQHFNDHSFIFTDGSVGDNSVGAAAACPGITLSMKLPSCCTIFSAEAQAILLALKYIDLTFRTKFVIFSDSKSVLDSLKHCNFRNPIISAILSKLNILFLAGKIIKFFWIPSHVGIKGNDRADLAANKARSYDVVSNIKIPYTDLKSAINYYCFSLWQASWSRELDNKLLPIKPSVFYRTLLHSPVRKFDTIITRLRIGHTHLSHSHLLSGSSAPLCPHCLSPLTIDHILISCPSLNGFRSRLSRTSDLHSFFLHNSCASIIDFLNHSNFLNLI